MLSELEKRTAQAIVNIFETGRATGDYGSVTLLAGDSGHLTYGRSQTTLASGNLFLLIRSYCQEPGAALAAGLAPYLERLERIDPALDHHTRFRGLLREAGDDPVMHEVQDAFFDRVYWDPALRSCKALGLVAPLACAVVYDSRIHGSWSRMRDRVVQKHGSVDALGEEPWIERYVETRRDWLATHPNRLLHRTVYRMDAFRSLIRARSWRLSLPLSVRGVTLDEDLLSGSGPIRISAEAPEERVLRLLRPFLTGGDVEALQRALKERGFPVEIDGIFGPATEMAVIRFQKRHGLRVDGIVGPATRAAVKGS